MQHPHACRQSRHAVPTALQRQKPENLPEIRSQTHIESTKDGAISGDTADYNSAEYWGARAVGANET